MDFTQTIYLVEQGIKNHVFPSAQVGIGVHDQLLVKKSFGTENILSTVPVTSSTKYDMASLTKVMVTSPISLLLAEQGKLAFDDTLPQYFSNVPEDKKAITLLHLLTHTSGFGNVILSQICKTPDNVVETILSLPLQYSPGTKTVYSCLGYILIGKILERITKVPLNILAAQMIFEPLSMKQTGYLPDQNCSLASTEFDSNTHSFLTGIVHDENARFLGGVSGNAGLFSTLDDCIIYAKMLACGGKNFFSPASMHASLRNYTSNMSENRGIGWKLAGGNSNFLGTFAPYTTFGHTGFTGTSLFVEPQSGLFAVLLSNRVHPTRENQQIVRFRRLFHNSLMAEFTKLRSKP